jgi:hypothetical protein
MGEKVWHWDSEEPKEEKPKTVAKPATAGAHVHEWTVYPGGKRKCKPCGAIERNQ